ncbi:MAG: MltA-interacting MipA [Methylophilales bacterium 28-44-11]|nr:MAG: MltA-interacting MipA [Methylophilales bacterium 28-44-11]
MTLFRPIPLLTLFAGCMLTSTTFADDKIDRDTETAIPRSSNLYGIGVAVLPKTSGSEDFRVLALPIINANYGERFYINALQAGVWLIDSHDKRVRFGLASQARFGWDADDGKLTRGMDDRDFSLDLGPTLRWQTDYGTFNAQWGFDVGGASHGQTLDLQFVKSLYRGSAFKLNGSAGITLNDHKFNDCYFGVGANETSAVRPAYSAGSSTEFKVGLNGSYAVGKDSYLLFGTSVTRLGDEQANSPIVETRMQPFAYFGYSIAY